MQRLANPPEAPLFLSKIWRRSDAMSDVPPSLQLIVGADAIAAYLGLKPRQVYAMREARNPLVKNVPGLGLVMSRTAAEAYFGVDLSESLRGSS